jgi:hypothetical protein
MLINNGTGSPSSWVTAPFQPDTRSDYAVEANIAFIRGCGTFGIIVRAVGQSNYASGPWCQDGSAQIWIWENNATSYSTLARTEFNPGTNWHTYRVEVKENYIRFLIDSTIILETTDNHIRSGGRIGLWSHQVQIEVRSFKVFAL